MKGCLLMGYRYPVFSLSTGTDFIPDPATTFQSSGSDLFYFKLLMVGKWKNDR